MAEEQARQWYLYMLQLASGQLYTGITTDVERRFAEHQSGSAKAAKRRSTSVVMPVYNKTTLNIGGDAGPVTRVRRCAWRQESKNSAVLRN